MHGDDWLSRKNSLAMITPSVTSTITVIENRLIETTALPRGCAALSGSGFSNVFMMTSAVTSHSNGFGLVGS